MFPAICRLVRALTFILTFAVVTTAQAQETIYSADTTKINRATKAGVGLIHWVQTEPGAEEHVIYVRNISSRPIQVTSYEVYDCQNIRGRVCGVHSPGPQVAPGKTVRLVIIRQSSSMFRASYHYRVQSVYTDSAAADTTRP